MPIKTLQTLFLCTLATAIAACSNVPTYDKPAIDIPATFKEAALFTPANPGAADVPDAWWTLFNDPVLNDLQARLPQANLSLQMSAAAVATAQAALGSSQAALLPTVSVSGGANRSANVSTSPKGTSYSVQGSLSSWEIDLWGRLGANVDAATARLQASQDTLAQTRLSLQATLSQTYFSLRTFEAQRDMLAQTARAYAKSLELTQNRYQGGVASAADVAQAQTQLKSTQAQQVEAQLQRSQLEHALATLVGQPAAAFRLPASTVEGGLPTPPTVPVQLPAKLLERRPDIAAAERQVAAANALIGVADSAFFPALMLSTSGGFRANDLGNLIQSANKFWSIGPSLVLGVFDGGARKAASASARASYDQTVATYKQTVLTALQEVEDNLVAASALEEEATLQQAALTAARRSLEIAQNQYKAGTVSYLNVVTAQTSVLSAEGNLLNVRNRRLAAVNVLLKNLAGRWG
jgi:NodT family efflux transporter outer membrane factor (OMF) lipoprotein